MNCQVPSPPVLSSSPRTESPPVTGFLRVDVAEVLLCCSQWGACQRSGHDSVTEQQTTTGSNDALEDFGFPFTSSKE